MAKFDLIDDKKKKGGGAKIEKAIVTFSKELIRGKRKEGGKKMW